MSDAKHKAAQSFRSFFNMTDDAAAVAGAGRGIPLAQARLLTRSHEQVVRDLNQHIVDHAPVTYRAWQRDQRRQGR